VVPPNATDNIGSESFTVPFAGWIAAFRSIAAGRYVPDAPVGPFGAAALAGSFVLLLVAVLVAARSRTLLGWTGLLFAVYGLSLSSALLEGRFLSSMRTLAPCVLAAGLVVLVALPAIRPRAPRAQAPAGRAG
jgi:hypothetical protein